MRFGVLGPLAVWTATGRPVRVPELKVRALLADLLSNRGRPVSVSRLIDDLWGVDVPAKPTSSLHAKVSQLRRALDSAEPGSRDLVVSLPSGYLLRIDDDAVDADRFASLTKQARTTEDPRARAALLGDALALWRGAAFADFAEAPFTRAVINRLEEDRLVALEQLAEARLALGEHSLLVGMLGDLVVRYPFRERLRATQLRALYRAGRPGDALASYAEFRAHLIAELGMDPSPDLVALHHAILVQDPSLDAVPAPGTLGARPRDNLPAQLTSLIGRAEATAEVCRLLKAGRLVTLTGSGGVGKTRLAVAAATELADSFPDGAWLVELAALNRHGGPDAVSSLAEAIMMVLGIREDAADRLPGGPPIAPIAPIDRLTGALRSKQLLLVLDNCEHMVDPVAKLVEVVLAAAPGLRVLATSQESIAVAGEVVWNVPPLRLPDPATEADPALVRQSSAVELFIERATAAAPGFTVDADTARVVAAICRRLDGIPLALELAATRVRALGVHELLVRLDDRFRLLAIGYRGAPPRQRTLRSMIDWSWELLTEPERIVLRRLAAHVDGCTLEAAETICAGDGVPREGVLDQLARLVERSLLLMTDGPHGPRYRLLESVAAYCQQRLEEADELESVRVRHSTYYAELAERAEPHLRGLDQRQWLQRLDAEAANLRRALDSAVRRSAGDLALRLVNALAWYWFLRGRLGEGHRSLNAVLALRADTSPVARAMATAWQAGLALLVSDATEPAVEPTVPGEVTDVDDVVGLARAQWFLGLAQWYVGALSGSEDRVNRALADFRACGDRWGVAAALSTRAALATARGDLAELERNGTESAALFRDLGDRWGQLKATNALGMLAEIVGDYEQAARLHRDGLHIAEDLGLWAEASHKLAMLGRIALLTNDFATAAELHERSRRLAAEQSNKFGEEFAEVGLALGARRQGQLEVAEQHLRKWLDWLREMKADNGMALVLAELGFIAEQRGEPEVARSLHLGGLDAARATGDPRAVALALEGLAGAQALAGDHHQAAQLLGAAAAARTSAGAPLPAGERGDVDRIASKALATLGEEAFTAEFKRGGELEADDFAVLRQPG